MDQENIMGSSGAPRAPQSPVTMLKVTSVNMAVCFPSSITFGIKLNSQEFTNFKKTQISKTKQNPKNPNF